MRTTRGASYVALRLRQTPRLFRNFVRVLFDLAAAEAGRGRREITFEMRNGLTVVAPNSDGARFPLFEIFGDDSYRLDQVCDGIDDGAVVLDIGGQIGSFTLAVMTRLPRARAHVYEASPTSASYVQRNTDLNGLTDRVVVHAEAIAGEAGEFTLVDSGTASAHNGLTAPDGLGVEVTVPATTFDEAVARAEGPVQIVKMDIEGAEYDVILCSDPASWTQVRSVVMEYHPVEGHTLEELTGFFAGVGIDAVDHDMGTVTGLGVMWLTRSGS